MCPGLKKGDVYAKYSARIKGYWKRVGSGLPVPPLPDCAAYARSHIGACDVNKVRPVWAYPLDVVAEESRFASPIIEKLVSQDIGKNTAYGCEMMINSQAALARTRSPGCGFFMSDYSSFDATVPAWVIRDVFALFEDTFDFSKTQTENGIIDADPVEERRRFRKCINYFINTPIRNCDGRRYQKAHGVPSGSMFTNIIDTFVNMLVTRTIFPLITKDIFKVTSIKN